MKQKKLQSVLSKLMKYATVQTHRTPLIPYFPSNPDPDRETLIENIKAITPNHTHRVECLELSETIQQKKKELYSPATKRIKSFENQLQIQHGHLHHSDVATVEDSHLRNIKVLFLEEKKEREKKNEQEFERLMKLDAKKRDQERNQMEELWRQQHIARERAVSLKARQIQSHDNMLRSVQQSSNQTVSSSNGRRKGGPFQLSRSDDRLLEAGNETQFNGVGDSSIRLGRSTAFHVTRSDDRLLDSGNVRHYTNPSFHARTFSDDQTHHTSDSTHLHNGPPKSIKLRPVPKGRHLKKMPQADLNKRKSIGYLGEFEDLQVYYDSLQAKQSGRQVTADSSGKLHHTSQSSFSSSGTSSSKHLPASSMTTTSRGSSNRGSLGNSGREMGGVSSTHQQQAKHQSLSHTQHQSGRDGMELRHKHPKMNGFPNRYSMYEHHSQPTSEGGMGHNVNGASSNSLSQPAEPELDFFRHKAFVSHSNDKPKNRTSGQYSHRVPLRSNSDDSLFEHSTGHPHNSSTVSHQQIHHDVSPAENPKWAMNIFTSDTLPVSKEKRQQLKQGVVSRSNRTGQLPSESSKVKSSGNKISPNPKQPTFHHSYTQHTPHGGKFPNQTSSSVDKTPPNNPVSHSNKSRTQYHSEPHRQPSTSSHRHRHASNVIPTHTHGHRPTVNLPIKPTRSAQIPTNHITSDTQLTSYPRSYIAAMNSMQMRSASNGRPLPVGGTFGNLRMPPSGGRGNQLNVYKPHPLHSGTNKDALRGSLV